MFVLGMRSYEAGSSSRMLKLFCPSLAKRVDIAVSGEERIDFGFIAGILGLDPTTVKLNTHLISRGTDLLSSCLTWKSLLSFFASRGLPTGSTDSQALIVHGKLSKSGSKRAHNPSCTENWDCCSVNDDFLVQRSAELEVTSDLKKKKVNGNSTVNHVSSSGKDVNHQRIMQGGFGFKRKATLEDVNVLKKKRIAEGNKSGSQDGLPDSILCNLASYNCIGGIKRPREAEPIMSITHKRVR